MKDDIVPKVRLNKNIASFALNAVLALGCSHTEFVDGISLGVHDNGWLNEQVSDKGCNCRQR